MNFRNNNFKHSVLPYHANHSWKPCQRCTMGIRMATYEPLKFWVWNNGKCQISGSILSQNTESYYNKKKFFQILKWLLKCSFLRLINFSKISYCSVFVRNCIYRFWVTVVDTNTENLISDRHGDTHTSRLKNIVDLEILDFSHDPTKCVKDKPFVWCLQTDYNREKHPYACNVENFYVLL